MKIVIKKSRLKTAVVFTTLIVVLWILFAFNYLNNDREAYKQLYNAKFFYGSVEIGYQLFSKILKVFVDFDGFQVVMSIGIMLCIGILLWKYSHDPLYSLMLYALFPFVLDTIQYRNTIAFCIINYALFVLYKYKDIDRRKGFVFYIMLIIFAGLFHRIAFIYLAYLLLYLPPKMTKKIIFAGVFAEICMFLLFPKYIQDILSFSSKAMMLYGKGFSTAFSTRIIFIVFLGIIPVMFLFLGRQEHCIMNQEDVRFLEYCKMISYMSILWYPLLIINVDFFRIYRNLIPLMEVGVVNYAVTLQKKWEYMLWKIILLIFNLLLAYFFIVRYSNNLQNLMHNRIFDNFWQ